MISFFLGAQIFSDQVAIVGVGHVGTVMGAIFTSLGHSVTFVDRDEKKIDGIKNNNLQIYEPDLEEAIQQANGLNLLKYSMTVKCLKDIDVFFICTETPPNEDGELDCSLVYRVLKDVLEMEDVPRLICVKSTLYPGSMKIFQNLINQKNQEILLVYNPEFMREGTALKDILSSNPLVFGANSASALNAATSFYAPLISQNSKCKIVGTNFETAELIKLAWNGFSAMRITYVNELSRLCEELNGDITDLVRGFSISEDMLPTEFITPGLGYGGSCFPKDTNALSKVFEQTGNQDSLIHQTIKMNAAHIETIIDRILNFNLAASQETSLAILGFSFKANTEDTRNSSAKNLVERLIKEGFKIKGYDSNLNNSMKQDFPCVEFYDSPYEAIDQTQCVIVLTDAKEHKSLDFSHLAQIMKKRKVVDLKNLFDVEEVEDLGFEILNMGRL